MKKCYFVSEPLAGIAGSKYSCIYFHLHQICPAVYNCYAVSKYAVHLIRGLQLTMQAINKSVDTWISIDLLGKEIRFFLWCSYSSSELAYLFYTESDIQAFKLNLPIFFSPLCLWTLLNKTKYSNYFGFVFVLRDALLLSFGVWAINKARLCWFNVIWVRISPAEVIHS